MPSKASYLFFFLATSLVLIGAQVFVYFQLRRILRRDFPVWARKNMTVIRWIFISMNLPLLFLFFLRNLKFDTSLLSQILLYPFTLWQFLILLWTLILIPFALIRKLTGKRINDPVTSIR